MNFIFSKIKFISSRHRVISSMYNYKKNSIIFFRKESKTTMTTMVTCSTASHQHSLTFNNDQPRPQGFSLKMGGKSPGDEVE